MRLAPPDEPPTQEVLTFTRNRPPPPPPSDALVSSWARHIIICVYDAFPKGTVQSLEAAQPSDCFGVIDQALDAGQGSRYLANPSIWNDLRSEFMPQDGRGCDVVAYHIAPTHVHVLIKEADGFALDAAVDRWKAIALCDPRDRRAPDRRVWAPGYFDTIIREPAAIEAARLAIGFHGNSSRPGGRKR